MTEIPELEQLLLALGAQLIEQFDVGAAQAVHGSDGKVQRLNVT